MQPCSTQQCIARINHLKIFKISARMVRNFRTILVKMPVTMPFGTMADGMDSELIPKPTIAIVSYGEFQQVICLDSLLAWVPCRLVVKFFSGRSLGEKGCQVSPLILARKPLETNKSWSQTCSRLLLAKRKPCNKPTASSSFLFGLATPNLPPDNFAW